MNFLRKYYKKLVAIFLVLLIWQIASIQVNNEPFVPSPQSTFNVIVEMIKTGALWKHVCASFGRVTL